MDIKQYKAKLEQIRDDLPRKVDIIIQNNARFIIGQFKLRLYNKGTDGEGKLIGNYTKKTIESKKKKGQKTSFVTLKDTGDFYGSLFLAKRGENYEITSSDPKAERLFEQYGDSILDLTEQETEKIILDIVIPQLQQVLYDFSDDLVIKL